MLISTVTHSHVAAAIAERTLVNHVTGLVNSCPVVAWLANTLHLNQGSVTYMYVLYTYIYAMLTHRVTKQNITVGCKATQTSPGAMSRHMLFGPQSALAQSDIGVHTLPSPSQCSLQTHLPVPGPGVTYMYMYVTP